MDILVEVIGEFILEILFEAKNNKKVPFVIRIFMMLILSLFYIGITLTFFIIGINIYKTNIPLGIFCILIGILLSIFFTLLLFRKDK